MKSVIDEVLRVEGWPRYTNHPDDRGGPTKGGITLATLRRWRKNPRLGVADLRAVQEDEARDIYRFMFITEPKFDGIEDELLQHQVIDCGVLSGPPRAAGWLQIACVALGRDLVVDQRVGPKTLAEVNSLPASALNVYLAAERLRFLASIVGSNYRARKAGRTSKDQSANIHGWTNRATKFLEDESFRLAELCKSSSYSPDPEALLERPSVT